MKVIIFPVIGHFKGAGELLKRKIREFDPEVIICRIDSEEEISGSPVLDVLKKFGKYEEKYCELEALKGVPFMKVEVSEEEMLKRLPEKFSVMDVIRYNLFLKRLSSDWEDLEEFLSWWEKAALGIKHIRKFSEVFSEKILEEVKKAGGKRILIVADYLTSKVLKEKMEELSLPYEFENYFLSSGIYSTKDHASESGF